MAQCPPDAEARTRLREAPLELRGRLANASNGTLLATLGPAPDVATEELLVDPPPGVDPVIYKPRAGERPLWDFPAGTLCQREAAAFEVSEQLGWGLVPPTVLRDGPLGPGSVQRFVPHDPREHFFTLVEQPSLRPELARVLLFDIVCNNADRKGSHVLLSADGHIRGIDHGLAFHADDKLRTVMWDLEGAPVASEWQVDLRRLADTLRDGEALARLLDERELAALARRADEAATLDVLPPPPTDRRPYPWPPL